MLAIEICLIPQRPLHTAVARLCASFIIRSPAFITERRIISQSRGVGRLRLIIGAQDPPGYQVK